MKRRCVRMILVKWNELASRAKHRSWSLFFWEIVKTRNFGWPRRVSAHIADLVNVKRPCGRADYNFFQNLIEVRHGTYLKLFIPNFYHDWHMIVSDGGTIQCPALARVIYLPGSFQGVWLASPCIDRLIDWLNSTQNPEVTGKQQSLVANSGIHTVFRFWQLPRSEKFPFFGRIHDSKHCSTQWQIKKWYGKLQNSSWEYCPRTESTLLWFCWMLFGNFPSPILKIWRWNVLVIVKFCFLTRNREGKRLILLDCRSYRRRPNYRAKSINQP